MANTHRVTMRFEDGDVAAIEAEEGETLYAAALRQKVRLVADCLEGVCATCKAVCREGRLQSLNVLDDALSEDEKKLHYFLACQTSMLSDCVVDFPYGMDQVQRKPAEERPYAIKRLERVSRSVALLDLAPVDGRALPFVAGQYAQIAIPGTSASRRYSFANAPDDESPLRFYIRLIPGGAMSEYLVRDAREGDHLSLSGPLGSFHLRPPMRPVLMVAGGTGLAPFLAMAEQLRGHRERTQPIHLLFGMPGPEHAFALDQIRTLAADMPGFHPEWIFENTPENSRGRSGFVTSLLHPELIYGGDCDAYLCGPPRMIAAVRDWLALQGLPADRIHTEEFLPS